MSEWGAKSDDAINAAVKSVLVEEHSTETELSIMFLESLKRSDFNYCGDPSHAWPIINAAYIEIARDSCQAHVTSYFNPEFTIRCRNNSVEILRAAMIVYLEFKRVKPSH